MTQGKSKDTSITEVFEHSLNPIQIAMLLDDRKYISKFTFLLLQILESKLPIWH